MESVRKSEERYRTIFDHTSDAMFIHDLNGKMLEVNKVACERLGVTREELLRMTLKDIDSPEYAELVPERMRQLMTKNYHIFETCHVRKDKSCIPTEVSARMIEHEGRPVILSIARDITERKRVEKALQETNDYLENLFNYANAPIIVWNPQFKITRFNRAFESLTGKKAADVIGQPLKILFPHLLVERSMELIRKTLTGDRWETVEIPILHQDGSVRTVLWNSATLFTPDKKTPVATIAQGQDITERDRAEETLWKSEAELRQKNAELGRFIYTLSHDLKSPLVTINTFMGYLKQDMADNNAERIKMDMNFILKAADKMSVLINELLELSRVGRVVNDPVPVTFQELADESLNAVAGGIAEKKVDVRVADVYIVLYGDRPRLAEIWQNLIENAVKYLGDQKAPRIDIGIEIRDQDTVFFVRDNGMGIAPRFHEKVFNLFEKLDPNSEGTGLGLTLVQRIVGLYDGVVWVESQGPGQGSCFCFTLPKALREKQTVGV